MLLRESINHRIFRTFSILFSGLWVGSLLQKCDENGTVIGYQVRKYKENSGYTYTPRLLSSEIANHIGSFPHPARPWSGYPGESEIEILRRR